MDGAVTRLPQGSAPSSLVAAMVIASVLRATVLPKGVELVAIADNIVVVGPTARAVERAYVALRTSFSRSPVGQLELRCDAAGRIVDGLDWLGVCFERGRGRCTLRPSARNLAKLRADVEACLGSIRERGQRGLPTGKERHRLERRVQGWTQSFRIARAGELLLEPYPLVLHVLVALHRPSEPCADVRSALTTTWQAARRLHRSAHARIKATAPG